MHKVLFKPSLLKLNHRESIGMLLTASRIGTDAGLAARLTMRLFSASIAWIRASREPGRGV